MRDTLAKRLAQINQKEYAVRMAKSAPFNMVGGLVAFILVLYFVYLCAETLATLTNIFQIHLFP